MKLEYYIVDVFAENQYSGNQLAVFLNTAALSKSEMQSIALETNFAETTFIESNQKNEDGSYNVRIFTPGTEVPFAGHPTLGTAFVISEYIEPGASKIIMNYPVGHVPVVKENQILFMTQVQPRFTDSLSHEETADILGLSADDLLDYPIENVSTGLPFYIVPLKSLEAVRSISINPISYRRLMDRLPEMEITPAFLSFAQEAIEEGHDLNCRMHYLENNQLVEDAATGSANGCLLSYLLKHNVLGKSTVELKVEQGYEINRPSLIYHKGRLENENYELKIGGKVQLVSHGEWFHRH